jgi:hypothetical protein
VWWQNTGQVLTYDDIIHHKDENKHNNHISNLEFKSRSQHSTEHGLEQGKPMITLQCGWCWENFELDVRSYKSRIKATGQTRFYCNRSHQVHHQQHLRKQK